MLQAHTSLISVTDRLRGKPAFAGVSLFAALVVVLGLAAIPHATGQMANIPQRAKQGFRKIAPVVHAPVDPAAIQASDATHMRATSAGFRDLGLAKPFLFEGSASDRDLATNCLAAAAWYEAGNDGKGQSAVIQVVLNRLKHPSFPKSVCGVVFQGAERTTGCQFTFTCDGSLGRRAPSPDGWRRAKARALAALNGAVDADVMQATHYHADYVAPWWSSQLLPLTKVGAHIFYRWRGEQGALSGHPVAGLDGDQLLERRLWGQGGTASNGGGSKAGLTIARQPLGLSKAALVDLPGRAEIADPAPGALILSVDPAGPSGRWAMEALNRCSRRSDCLVVSYGGVDIAPAAQLRSYAHRERPLFLYVRDSASGMDLALWDCTQTSRPSARQCLPDDRHELLAIMKPRNNIIN